MTKLIYENPKNPKERSSPVGEDETTRRKILEGAGWVVVDRLEDAPPAEVPQETEAKPSARKRKEAPAEVPAEERQAENDTADGDEDGESSDDADGDADPAG